MAKRKHSASAADRVIAFFRRLRLPDGSPYILDPWQEHFLRRLFGTRGRNGARQYTTAFLSVARRNGKTFLLAGVVLYLLVSDRRQRIFAVASTVDQAGELYLYARQMAEATPGLAQIMRCTDYYRRIECTRSGMLFRCVSSDAGGAHGKGVKYLILDELHAWKSGGHRLYEALSTSQGTFERGRLLVAITTAAAAGAESSAAGLLYRDAKRIEADPTIDPSILVALYEAEADCELDDRAQWRRANPALGNYRSASELEEKCRRAMREPAWEPAFRQLYLNQWFVGGTTTHHVLLPIWDRGSGPLPPLAGEPCYAGIDIAQRYDYCACVLLFPAGERYFVRPYYWLPEEIVDEKSARERAPIRVWAQQGHVRLQPGATLNLESVLADLEELQRGYQVQAWAFDPWHDQYLYGALEARGVRTLCQVRQTFHGLSAAAKEMIALLREGRIVHGDHPVLTHQARGLAMATDGGGNMKPDRDKSAVSIDGIPALLMALARSFGDRHRRESVYERRGLLVF